MDFDVKVEIGRVFGKAGGHGAPAGTVSGPELDHHGRRLQETDTIFILEVKLGYDNCRPEEDLENVVGVRPAGRQRGLHDRRRRRAGAHREAGRAEREAGHRHRHRRRHQRRLRRGEASPRSLSTCCPSTWPGPSTSGRARRAPAGLRAGRRDHHHDRGQERLPQGHGIKGTGTTSDAVAIACPIGAGDKYCGPATDAGMVMARTVREAVSESITQVERQLQEGPRLHLPPGRAGHRDGGDVGHSALPYVPDPAWDTEIIEARS